MAAAAAAAAKITAAYLQDVLVHKVPLVGQFGIRVLQLQRGRCVVSIPFSERFLRPGGTITGPLLFGLADVALYGAVMSCIGPQELTVTTNMHINFLRKPGPADVLADATILKLGKRLAVGEVGLYSERLDSEPVAHVTGTYSIPPPSSAAAGRALPEA